MKKTLGLFAAAMLLVGGVAFADEAMLIDFTLLDADCVEDENGNATQNKHTVMDFSVSAGSTFTDDQRALMRTSLVLPEWEVVLNSSANTVSDISILTASTKMVPTTFFIITSGPYIIFTECFQYSF